MTPESRRRWRSDIPWWSAVGRVLLIPLLLLSAGVLAACGGSGDDDSPAPAATSSRPRPAAGPAATITGPIAGGKGTPILAAVAGMADLKPKKYVESEYFATGTAQSYTAPDAAPADGRVKATPGATADYRTRIIVRRPGDPTAFNGTLIIEWLNVTGGQDADPDWAYLAPEIMRSGYAWVGVTTQKVGIDGVENGGILPDNGFKLSGLREADPERYGSLRHPGDAYSYDIFTQVGQALRNPASDGEKPLGTLVPKQFIAVGESQSAATLSTYIDTVQPLTHQFDGFLVHSRGAGLAPLNDSVKAGDINSAKPVPLRSDTDVPILVFETETDLIQLGYAKVTQPDSALIRVWEVAGTSHADTTIIGNYAEFLGCDPNINDGPQLYVIRAALATLSTWVHTGKAPPSAPRLQVSSNQADLARDEHGIALGGIRTPVVDVPVSTLSGVPGKKGGLQCAALGSTTALDPATVRSLYLDRNAYLAAFAASTDSAIKEGYLLPADRKDMIARAETYQFPPA
ncbi:alpha/beta hydrolase domain-containing protein [Parafrankia sp. EAN1pec]|uniref:alpha/beta hydrolase domain-containing protein n=1 Tax=Parafrankia sp. (strain EAN1pec) TaxID=298653 RepID=UPI0032190F91